MSTFELYFTDLTKEAQDEILKKAGIKIPEEANWDICPITYIDFEV